MSDVKNRLKNMLAVNKEKAAVAAEKSDHVAYAFRPDSFDDVEAVGKALKENFLVLLDITACGEECARRIRDFMKGVAYPMQVWIQEMGENILVYLPDGHQTQGFQNQSILFFKAQRFMYNTHVRCITHGATTGSDCDSRDHIKKKS